MFEGAERGEAAKDSPIQSQGEYVCARSED